MSVIVSTSQQICHSPTNTSKAKMLYSFSRSSRFPNNKQNQCDKFYQINRKRQTRATAIGYGNKYDFTTDVPKTPPPGTYESLSIFGEAKKKNKGFGFGSGRQQMQLTGSLSINKNPGPGAYELGAQQKKSYFSMRGKGKINNRQTVQKPGPGAYESFSSFNSSGFVFFSQFKNKFGCKFTKQQKLRQQNKKVPGPGSYDISKTQFSPQGKYFYSRLKSAKGQKFGKTIKIFTQNRSQTPGPGNYRLPTQFGYYRSKYATETQNEINKNNTISYDV